MKKLLFLLPLLLCGEIFAQTTSFPGDLSLGDGSGDGNMVTRFADGQHFRFYYPRWVGGYEWSTSSSAGTVDLMRLTGYNGTNKLFVNGKVGIGVSSPSASLHVKGNTIITGNLELEGTGAGMMETDFVDGKLFKFFYPRWQGGWEWTTGGSAGEVKVMKLANLNGQRTLFVNGKLGVGTENMGDFHISVAGKMRAEEVRVYTGWADFVFADEYVLPPLADVEAFIKENRHLPEIPSEAEVKENGIELGVMNAKLLQKIEELTLYMIELKKENEELRGRLEMLESKTN